MLCDRFSAIRRLVNLYIEQLAADPDYHRQVKIADVLSEKSIAMVQSLDLHPEMDSCPPDVRSDDRDLKLLLSWLSSASMGRLH
jgi:hypothetical protein